MSDDDSNSRSSPLATVVGILVAVMGFGSAILWHTSSGTLTVPISWLMTPVSHSFFKIFMVVVLTSLLVFGCVVTFLQRPSAEAWTRPEVRPGPPPKVAAPPMARRAPVPPTAPDLLPPDPFESDGT